MLIKLKDYTRKSKTRKVKEPWLPLRIELPEWAKEEDDFELFKGCCYVFNENYQYFEIKVDWQIIPNAICLHLERNVTDYRKRQYKKRLKDFLEFLMLKYDGEISYA